MINESYYWKKPLLKSANWLEKARINDVTGECIIARAEREIFIGFYAVRKLLETFKLSTKTKSSTYNLIFFSAKDNTNPNYFTRDEIERHFFLDIEKSENRDIGFICNQLIHSFIFIFSISDSGHLDGFYLSSDRVKNSKLYYIPITTVIEIFRIVGNDYPRKQHLILHKTTNQWREISSE